MTSTLNHEAPPVNGDRPASFGVTPGRRRQRRIPAAVAAGLVAVLGALLGVAVYGTAMTTTTVLAVARPVKAGQAIAADDLTVADVRSDPALSPIELSAKSTVIGKVATTDLVPGSLLVPGQLGDVRPLEAGESLVGIEVQSAAAPGGWLRSGDRVQVVSTAKSADGTSDAVVLTEARIVSVATNRTNTGGLALSVAVAKDKAAAVAAASAGGKVGVVLLENR